MNLMFAFVLVFAIGGCSNAAIDETSTRSLSALPADIQREVSAIPSICLVVRDFDHRLSYEILDRTDRPDPGFLAIPIEGKPNESDLFPGVDSFAVSTPYILIGCDNSAKMPDIVKQAFVDAKKRNARIKLWAKIDGIWKSQS